MVLLLGPVGAAAQTPAPTPKPAGWAVYVTAHPDDWQLFMGGSACDDVQRTRRKVVFICLTAGQADQPEDAYWQAREVSCRAAMQQAVQLPNKQSPLPAATTLIINQHAVVVARSHNAVAYFLRLPDGNLNGRGQARGGYQSLQQLRDAGRAMLPLDGGKPYQNWNELVATVRHILRREAVPGQLALHAPMPDSKLNPGDHSDHRMAGLVALAATARTECCYRLYVGYDSRRRPANLTSEQAANQLLVYQAYSQSMRELGQYPSWDAQHLSYIGRQYAHVRHTTGASLLDATAPAPTPGPVPPPGTPDDLEEGASTDVVLEPNFPNPFDTSTLLVYRLPAAAPVWLRVLDAQGREVLRPLKGAVQAAGSHEQWLDVTSFPAAGLYVAELRAGNQRRTCRLHLVR
ncbi:PIG-L family deacetylase [Hymenobacter weizhouensis]|uniref:PIG-L family deacetylase n=1 Tax=Hymenobacter sp. YIM 151500-1 TaxID=2987689 RepID=UPI0022265C31|nr:PIG-L family deacetylase [Hymenobacter sp. YIM 151500-1]UYZ62102.1 PIG-L family deacetylase [Hymenobacter sp. YIM 151500-1]